MTGIRTNKVQSVSAITVYACCAYIHGSIEIEILTVASDGALCISTCSIRSDEVVEYLASAGRRGANLVETTHYCRQVSVKAQHHKHVSRRLVCF